MRRIWVPVVALGLVAGCGGSDGGASEATSPPPTTTIVTTPTETPTSTSIGETPTTVPEPDCAEGETLALVDETISRARLAAGGPWSTGLVADAPFADRTTSGAEFARRLGLACGLAATQTAGGGQRLVLAAWTGPRIAFVVQASDGPSTPYRADATVNVLIGAPRGEFLDGDERARWAATLDGGETFVVGHADYQLGPVAKGWSADVVPPSGDEPVSIDAERHALAALEQSGMADVGIAQPPEFDSEEGYVQFVSPTGQILVADVAPDGWFDPMAPRYFTGPTAIESIEGVEVRISEPVEGDNLGFTRGAEFGWACAGYVWILEPPANGDADETRRTVAAIVATDECQGA